MSDDDYLGRGYVAVELVNDICVVYDVDDGTFDYVNLSNIFRLGIDHAAIPAFCTRMCIAGVKPRTGAIFFLGCLVGVYRTSIFKFLIIGQSLLILFRFG